MNTVKRLLVGVMGLGMVTGLANAGDDRPAAQGPANRKKVGESLRVRRADDPDALAANDSAPAPRRPSLISARAQRLAQRKATVPEPVTAPRSPSAPVVVVDDDDRPRGMPGLAVLSWGSGDPRLVSTGGVPAAASTVPQAASAMPNVGFLGTPELNAASAMPGTDVPQLGTVDMPVPQMPVPQMDVPQMPVPQLPVPQMDVPQMPVPQMPVPEMPVPQMAVPQMAVPEMAVPQMDIPLVGVGAMYGTGMSAMPMMMPGYGGGYGFWW